jgi:hypothetical protein
MRAQLKAVCWLVGAVACGDHELADPDQAALDPQSLVAHAGEPCGAGAAAAADQGRRAMAAAGLHWERLPFDGNEGARAIHLARSARACFELSSSRAEQREAEAWLLQKEQALYLAVQAARRAFVRARALGRNDDAAQHGERLLALLEAGNPATEPARKGVQRWRKLHEGTEGRGVSR